MLDTNEGESEAHKKEKMGEDSAQKEGKIRKMYTQEILGNQKQKIKKIKSVEQDTKRCAIKNEKRNSKTGKKIRNIEIENKILNKNTQERKE